MIGIGAVVMGSMGLLLAILLPCGIAMNRANARRRASR